LDHFDDCFLVLLINGIVTLLVIVGLIVVGNKPAGKGLALLVMVLLLITSVWWIVATYEIDEIQESSTKFQTFLDNGCIGPNSFKNFFSKTGGDIRKQLDYYDDEENALHIVGWIVTVLALLCGIMTALYKGTGKSDLRESTAKDEKYHQLQADKFGKDKQY